jgi:hypothetical protein
MINEITFTVMPGAFKYGCMMLPAWAGLRLRLPNQDSSCKPCGLSTESELPKDSFEKIVLSRFLGPISLQAGA